MDRIEIDSFVNKFKALCDAGYHASLNLESKLGEVFVNLSCKVGRTTPPPSTPPAPFDAVPKYRSPSYYRRQARRKMSRESQVVKVDESTTLVAEEANVAVNSEESEYSSAAVEEVVVGEDADQSIELVENANKCEVLRSSPDEEATVDEVINEQEYSDTISSSESAEVREVEAPSNKNDILESSSRRNPGMCYYAFVPPPMKQ